MTADQTVAYWNGLPVQVTARMARSPGVVPDRGEIVFRTGGDQPEEVAGRLEFQHDGDVIDYWEGCRIIAVNERRGKFLDMVYTLEDRRWKLHFPTISGSYNVRDTKRKIQGGTKRTARALAVLILESMGERSYDVTAIPDNDDLLPEIDWKLASSAQELMSLCMLFGCMCHLAADGTVKIWKKGTGVTYATTNAVAIPNTGIVVPKAPDAVIAAASPDLFEDWILLRAVGYEIDIAGDFPDDLNDSAKIELVADLSYRPPGGFKDLDLFTDVDTFLLGLSVPLYKRQKVIELCKQTIMRTYEVDPVTAWTGRSTLLSQQEVLYPGFAEWNSGVLYVYVENSSAIGDSVTFADWVPGSLNHSWTVLNASVNVLEFTLLSNPGDITFAGRILTNVTVTDKRQILPLVPTRLVTQEQLTEVRKPSAAEVIGFWVDHRNANVRPRDSMIWTDGISISAETGLVTLGKAAHRLADDGSGGKQCGPAVLLLRCGHVLRRKPYAPEMRRFHKLTTGVYNATKPEILSREDLAAQFIQKYTNEYQVTLGISGDPTIVLNGSSNTATLVDQELLNTATARVGEYQVSPQPITLEFIPPKLILTDGVINQVTIQCGVRDFGVTTMTMYGEHDLAQPPYLEKSRTEKLRLDLERQMGAIAGRGNLNRQWHVDRQNGLERGIQGG